MFTIKSGVKCQTKKNENFRDPDLLSADNLPSAKTECMDKEDCIMFYDECGKGKNFRYCSKLGSENYPAPVKSTMDDCNGKEDFLYIKGKSTQLSALTLTNLVLAMLDIFK